MISRFAVILPAAGQSLRFGKAKLLEPLAGVAVIRRSVDAFACRADVSHIVVATNLAERIVPLLPRDSRIRVVPGGENRAATVRLAAQELPADIEWVAVHDAARPLVSQVLIDRTLAAASQVGAAGPAMPVHLTIRKSSGVLPARSAGIVPRASLVAMQTPQILRLADLQTAFAKCSLPLATITDDLQLLENIGSEPLLVPGEETNLKITTPGDLLLAEMLLNSAATKSLRNSET